MRQAISAFAHEFARHRRQMEQAISTLTDEQFFESPGERFGAAPVNSIALIVKHLSGNLASRWSDFLSTDGDKPNRNRDQEFVREADDTRAKLLQDGERAWGIVENTLADLTDADLGRSVTIRGEPHTVLQALIRGVDHVAYHTGQVLYIARLWQPTAPWLTIAPGTSAARSVGSYLRPPGT